MAWAVWTMALTMAQLALQSRFHGPLAVEPYPSHPIFTRQRVPSTDDGEAQPAPGAEPSFYRNTYAMVGCSVSLPSIRAG
jgi:hypothetical protein